MHQEYHCKIMEKYRQISEYASVVSNSKLGRVLVLTGARQVGKTTLVKKVLSNYHYISIEDPVGRDSFLALSAAQWRQLYPQAALDEVQKAPRLVESIKATYDNYEDVRYVLLGSSQLLLLEKVRESLAGRCTILEMFPLTLPELLTNGWQQPCTPSPWQQLLAKPNETPSMLPSFLLDPMMAQKQQAWDYLLRFGGYPALIDPSLSDEDRYVWLTNYVRTYLERDVRDLANFRDLEPYSKLQRAVAAMTAQTFSLTTLSRDAGVSVKTVQRYLQYLTLSYQTLVLPAWDRNAEKRIAKAPKVHFMDQGVLQAVLQKRGGMTGAEFESAIVCELYKQARNCMAEARFHHLRTQDGREVDLLVELPQGYFAFEIKMSQHVQTTDTRHLRNLQSFLDKPLLHSFVLSSDVRTQTFQPGITAVNAAMFLG